LTGRCNDDDDYDDDGDDDDNLDFTIKKNAIK
jgi:hypothetical protein